MENSSDYVWRARSEEIAENGLPVLELSKADHAWFSRVALRLRTAGHTVDETFAVLTDAAAGLEGRPAVKVHGKPVAFARTFGRGSLGWSPGRRLVAWVGGPVAGLGGVLFALWNDRGEMWLLLLALAAAFGAYEVIRTGERMDSTLPPHLHGPR